MKELRQNHKAMTTTEILANFLKGNELTTISEKQKSWLIGQAQREGLNVISDGFNEYIHLTDCLYKIKQCSVKAGGYGGTIGIKFIAGKYRLERLYSIKFESTGLTGIYRKNDLQHFTEQGHAYSISQTKFPMTKKM